MVYASTITQCQRDLNTLYSRIAREDSHYQFVTTCLRSHTIPRGLTINVHPCVPKAPCREPAARLQKQWAQIVRRAANGFLAALKTYHRSCAYHLRLQATNLESFIAARLGETRAETSKNIAKTVYAKCDRRLRERRNRKLKHLLPPDSRIRTIRYQQQKKRRRRFRRRESHSTRTSSDPEVPTTVVNLSGNALSEAEINLLSKGLSFCPTPRHIEKEQILDDLEKFFRRLRLKEFFLKEEEEEEDSDARTLFHLPSTWMPPKRTDAALETYMKETRMDVERHLENLQTKRFKDNLPPEERSTLEHLRQCTDIIIKPADK